MAHPMSRGQSLVEEIIAAMSPAERAAHLAQERAVKAAQARRDRSVQALQASFNRRMRKIVDRYESEIEVARQAYRDAENAAAASVDTHPKGGDGEAAPFMSGAVGSEADETPSSPSDHPGERA